MMINIEEITSRPSNAQKFRDDGSLQSEAWVVRMSQTMNIFVHRFYGNDFTNLIHDHPWESASFCIDGEMKEQYVENGELKERIIKKGDIVYRTADFTHCLHGYATTVYITGHSIQELTYFLTDDWENERKVKYSDLPLHQNITSSDPE